jgi:hypothetical protein
MPRGCAAVRCTLVLLTLTVLIGLTQNAFSLAKEAEEKEKEKKVKLLGGDHLLSPRWQPKCNYTVSQLRSLVHADLLAELQHEPGNATSRAQMFREFDEAFADPEYRQHGFLMGTERSSPMRKLNQLLHSKLAAHSHAARAVKHVDSAAQLPNLSLSQRSSMGTCGRAVLSRMRAEYLLNFTRLQAAPPPTTAPNVVFLIADDLGWADVGVHSADIFTPFVDALHSQGVALDNYYVDLVCTPSRASFQTGRFPATTGVTTWFSRSDLLALPLQEFTMGDMFREAGYATHYVGKWHLGYYCPEATPTCVRACVRMYVRARARACVRACVGVFFISRRRRAAAAEATFKTTSNVVRLWAVDANAFFSIHGVVCTCQPNEFRRVRAFFRASCRCCCVCVRCHSDSP